MNKIRKITKFNYCPKHAPLMVQATRRRQAEICCEGGPAGWSGCSGGTCVVLPGTDFYSAEYCTAPLEMEWTKLVTR